MGQGAPGMQLLGVASCTEVGCSMMQLPLSELATHASVSNSSPESLLNNPISSLVYQSRLGWDCSFNLSLVSR